MQTHWQSNMYQHTSTNIIPEWFSNFTVPYYMCSMVSWSFSQMYIETSEFCSLHSGKKAFVASIRFNLLYWKKNRLFESVDDLQALIKYPPSHSNSIKDSNKCSIFSPNFVCTLRSWHVLLHNFLEFCMSLKPHFNEVKMVYGGNRRHSVYSPQRGEY